MAVNPTPYPSINSPSFQVPTSFEIPGKDVYDGMVIQNGYIDPRVISRIPQFRMGGSDILIATYPRTGSTWLRAMVGLFISSQESSAMDDTNLAKRKAFLEVITPTTGLAGIDRIAGVPHPWIMNSHLPARYFLRQLKEDKPKIIVGMRNPKDMLVSLYYFYQMNEALGAFTGSWDDFFELFKDQRLIYGDYFDWCNSWWSLRREKNVLVIRYEDMIRDLKGSVETIDRFLGGMTDDSTISRIVEQTTFRNMRDNPQLNMTGISNFRYDVSQFCRKGVVGDWKNYFTPEQSQYVDKLYEENCVPNGLTFEFE